MLYNSLLIALHNTDRASSSHTCVLQHADLDQRQRDDTVRSFLERVSRQTSHASSDDTQAVKGQQPCTSIICIRAQLNVMVARHLFVAKVPVTHCPFTCLSHLCMNASNVRTCHVSISRIKHLPTAGSASAEVLITTDACVKALEEEENSSLSLTLLVNYDLPAKRVCTACSDLKLCQHVTLCL